MSHNKKGLELSLVSLGSDVAFCPNSNHSYDPEFADERAVLADGCDILAESSALRFIVTVFGERWPVDLATDLAVVLEQLPDTLHALREGRSAVLDFYEQGIERVLLFSGGDEKTIDLRCKSRHPGWKPGEPNASLDRDETIAMLQSLGTDFADLLSQACSDLAGHPWLRAWQSRLESNVRN